MCWSQVSCIRSLGCGAQSVIGSQSFVISLDLSIFGFLSLSFPNSCFLHFHCLSGLGCPLTHNRSLVSCVSLYWSLVEVRYRSLVSSYSLPVPGVWSFVKGIWWTFNLILGFRSFVSLTLVSGFWFAFSSFHFLVTLIRFPLFGYFYSVSSLWLLLFGFFSLVTSIRFPLLSYFYSVSVFLVSLLLIK